MDEAKLRNFLQILTTRLLPKFNQDAPVEENMAFLCSQSEARELLEDGKLVCPTSNAWPDKDSELASQNKNDGNEAYQGGKFDLALLLYTEALRYSPVDLHSLESEDFASCCANRSATLFQLGRYEECLEDIKVAIESGYPSNGVYKLCIRQCKCLLHLGRISQAQKAFDYAVEAIDRSGLQKGLRKNLAVELQEAFINLAKDIGEDEASSREAYSGEKDSLPHWTELKSVHKLYPSANDAITINFSDTYGRQVLAVRDIEVGEVLFNEMPIISHLVQEADHASEACYHCMTFLETQVPLPCPSCSNVVFCGLKCRNAAYRSYHCYECKLSSVFRQTKLDQLPLIMLTFKAIAQKPVEFFLESRDMFETHDTHNGVEEKNQFYDPVDYKNLFNLITHQEKRESRDIVTKTVFAVFLLQCLKFGGYFERCSRKIGPGEEHFIGKLILHFLQCFQFNTHMIESVYENRLIAQDAETRLWKDAKKFSPGEFVETVRLGGGIFPTLANVNHSCDPNIMLLNWERRAIAIANRPIRQGEQIFDTYGAVYYHMSKEERQTFLEVPSNGQIVNITSPILLDTATNELGGVFINGNGRLVFSPDADLAKLVTNFVLIDDDGSLEIGSKDCKFAGNAEILLTGKRNPANDIGDYGQKFIGVGEKGSLEIHGEDKVSWTLLDQNLLPKSKLFDSEEPGGVPNENHGLIVFEFLNNGTIKEITGGISTAAKLKTVLDLAAQDAMLIITKKKWFGCTAYLNKRDLTETLERELNLAPGAVSLDQLTYYSDAYVLMVDRATGTFNQSMDRFNGAGDTDGSVSELLRMTKNDVIYFAQCFTNPANTRHVPNKVIVTSVASDFFDNTINVVDDVDWEADSRVVIASTDYDFAQAETFKVTGVNGKIISIHGEVKYEHWGAFNEGVDMRAEVGLLTRNVKIHGKMEKDCYVSDVNDCIAYDKDNFGGHTVALENFTAYTINGAELFDMGQTGILGKYPIHFHMALNTTRNGLGSEISNNVIRQSNQRCITVHTSHHVRIVGNVAYDHVGHCYFLEDGAERHTHFEGNLGLLTKSGSLVNSDKNPTTFWITSPETTLIGNRAAGSVFWKGVGFWFLFPDIPAGPSELLGIYEKHQAKYTPITKFKDNVAHSNGHSGLAVFRRLSSDHGIIGCSTYSPREDPSLKSKSKLIPVVFDGFHGYKNNQMNVVMRTTSTELVNFHLSDSLIGVRFNKNQMSGYQRISNSTIIGESTNVGVGGNMLITDDEGKRSWVPAPRSLPIFRRSWAKVAGVQIHAEGPTHIQNVDFKNFCGNNLRRAAAIAWEDKYHFHNGATTSAQGLTFDYQCPSGNEKLHIVDWDETVDGRGESSIMIRDVDGSLAGTQGRALVHPNTYFTQGDTCSPLPGANMISCDARYVKFFVWPYHTIFNASYITDEQGNKFPYENEINMKISYTVSSVPGVYVLNWNTPLTANSFNIRMTGLEKDDEIIVGACLPRGVKQVTSWWKLYGLESGESPAEASSLAELQTDASKNVFFDTDKEILYRKFTETNERTDADLYDCIGDLRYHTACKYLNIKLKHAKDEGFVTDVTNVQCDDR